MLTATWPQGSKQNEQSEGGCQSSGNEHCNGAERQRADGIERGNGAMRPGSHDEAIPREPRSEPPTTSSSSARIVAGTLRDGR